MIIKSKPKPENKPIQTAFKGSNPKGIYEIEIDVVIKNGISGCNVIDSLVIDVYGSGITVETASEVDDRLDKLILENVKAKLLSSNTRSIELLTEYQ